MNQKNTQRSSQIKLELRKRFLDLRKKLTAAEVWEKSEIIGQKLLNIPEVAAARSISVYLPIKNEVTTKSIIDALVARGVIVHLPTYVKPLLSSSSFNFSQDKLRGSDFGYVFSRFNGWENLVPGPHGILQPSSNRHPALDAGSSAMLQIDVSILPGVAFDLQGVRLGYGKGVFDRLLAHSKAFKIGLAYDFQVVDELPKEEHDLVMDLVVTEKRII